jgi:hypothetical protein
MLMRPCRSNGRQGTHVNVSQTYGIEGYRPSVVNISRCHVTRASSVQSDLVRSRTFLKSRWTVFTSNMSRNSTPRQNSPIPGGNYPLAPKVGICRLPSSHGCCLASRRPCRHAACEEARDTLCCVPNLRDIEGHNPSMVNVSRCHVTRASSSRSDLKGSLTDLPFLKGRWTLSRPFGTRGASRKYVPRRRIPTQGEEAPLA